ncbi:hypothetical protein Tco_1489132 [Tanacetum coccineum]
MISRSMVGVVKAWCFLAKLHVLCEEQGLNNIEVKLLGGLEVMVVLENVEAATNVLKVIEHGLGGWLYKMRKENTFRRITAMHGTILAFHKCRMEGNQNVTYCNVQIHTNNKGLIKEDLIVRVNGKDHIVNVVEKIRDITVIDIQEVCKVYDEEKGTKDGENKLGDTDMEIDDRDKEDTVVGDSLDGKSSDEDEGSNVGKVFGKSYFSNFDSGKAHT